MNRHALVQTVELAESGLCEESLIAWLPAADDDVLCGVGLPPDLLRPHEKGEQPLLKTKQSFTGPV